MNNEELIKELLYIINEEHKIISEAGASINRMQDAAKAISDATHEQTQTFIMQINKLSQRLDAAERERFEQIQLQREQGARIDKLLEVLHDATRKTPDNNNTYNNM